MDDNQSEGDVGSLPPANLEGAGDGPVVAQASCTDPDDEDLMETVDENLNHPFVRALQFDLVAEKIVSLINFEDMKALSVVSLTCLQAVRKTKGYTDLARFIVCKDVIELGVLKECTFMWKHVSLNLSIPVDVLGLIEDMLHSATSLCLKLPDTHGSTEGMVDYLSGIFKRTKNLEALQLDASIFNCILHDVFSDIDVQTVFSNLKILDIQSQSMKRSICYIDGAEDDDDTPFQRNFLQLSMVPLQLKKFVFGKVLTIMGSESEQVKFIPRIVDATKDSLEELELHLNVWKFDEMKGIRCSRLKRLILSADGKARDAQIVKTFLKNQPPLEELTIEMNNEFPFSILQAIQGMTSKMKVLHIKAKTFSETSTPVDWSFLETIVQLRDFHIRKPTTFGDSGMRIFQIGEEILRKLPHCVEKISIQGVDQFWKEQFSDPGNIGALLEPFQNLKELNFLRSCGAFTDEGLQTVITNCKNLVSLTFSHCSDVTDFGISGIRKKEDDTEEKVGVSIKDLKGLNYLKIRSCPNVNAETLLKEVEFDHLRVFDYYKNVQLPRTFLLQIAKQNPCLEEVALHITSYEDDMDYVRELKREVKEIRPRLHLIEILEQSNWEDEDSDSDASSKNDSDFSGGGYRIDDDDDLEFDVDEDYDDSPDFFDAEDDFDDEDDFF